MSSTIKLKSHYIVKQTVKLAVMFTDHSVRVFGGQLNKTKWFYLIDPSYSQLVLVVYFQELFIFLQELEHLLANLQKCRKT